MVIQGYRIHSTDISDVMLELEKVKKKLKTITNREYNKLLAEEITFLVDQVTLNVIPKDANTTIYDGAIQNLEDRIARSQALNDYSKYNFRVFAHIMPDGEYSYLKVICPNKNLLKAFGDIEEYSLNETECEDIQNAKTQLWNKLCSLYKDSEPMVISLTQSYEPNKDKLQFESVQIRAEVQARHNTISKLLNEIGGGREISPIRLMPFLDEAFEIFSENDDIKTEYQQNVTKLQQVLINLNQDHSFIFELPG